MLGGASVAEPLYEFILGYEWLPAVIFFQILCLGMMLYPIHAFNLNILNVYGRSDLFLKLELIKKSIAVFSILFAFQFGVIGLVWSYVFASFASLFVNMYYSSRIIEYPVKEQFQDLIVTLFISASVAIVMYNFQLHLYQLGSLLQFSITLVFGSLLYVFLNFLNKKSPIHESLILFKNRLSR